MKENRAFCIFWWIPGILGSCSKDFINSETKGADTLCIMNANVHYGLAYLQNVISLSGAVELSICLVWVQNGSKTWS